ncbi:hypothetical protein [Cytobacillus sp. NCCP-133]|uniref:hypothetical protein n=1 Tax=Cytobacillus sp. NCCP-133 TaxID=766848 RepID=UPI00222E78C3|nr:hypothetical protein [Cytobacillus sp. NCCP-133]GLB59021.1 hypothetical protein NCCP133_11540 [Cytobacillus sp. NCCP-133]
MKPAFMAGFSVGTYILDAAKANKARTGFKSYFDYAIVEKLMRRQVTDKLGK